MPAPWTRELRSVRPGSNPCDTEAAQALAEGVGGLGAGGLHRERYGGGGVCGCRAGDGLGFCDFWVAGVDLGVLSVNWLACLGSVGLFRACSRWDRGPRVGGTNEVTKRLRSPVSWVSFMICGPGYFILGFNI